jgi:hypothetical protein
MTFRYLIGLDTVYAQTEPTDITHVGYDVDTPVGQTKSAYCNLFNEKFSEQSHAQQLAYGPYLDTSDTAFDYGEGQIDPKGQGWHKNLMDQFERRKASGFEVLELDNPDAYSVRDVLGAHDLAFQEGFLTYAKNPGLYDDFDDQLKYVMHTSVVGIIIERGAGDPAEMDKLRKAAGKPDLPCYFVFFDRTARAKSGWKAAQRCAGLIKDLPHMQVTYSERGEYTNAKIVTA